MENVEIESRWLRELDDAQMGLNSIRNSLGDLVRVADSLVRVLRQGGCVFACGNGGSALAAQHFVAELVGHFRRDRVGLRALALLPDPGLLTAIANDYGYLEVYSRQIQSLGTAKDALLAFSTSGESGNVLKAVESAREMGMLTVALSGGEGGSLARLADQAFVIPTDDTARIQEGHLILIHLMSERIDAVFGADQE